jgi:sugar lactone lactonase YvrE
LGNMYVADQQNHRIRKITPAGLVSTLAGSGEWGFADGASGVAQFNGPNGIAVDASGNVYVADDMNHRIRKITPAGVVSTLAGNGTAGFNNGTGEAAQFYAPMGIAIDASGNLYVADGGNHRIRKVTPAGVVTTFAGNGTAGYVNGAGVAAQFNSPTDVAVDASGNMYVADLNNRRIRKITPAGFVTTFAGSGADGNDNGTGEEASFRYPVGVATDASGNVYVADFNGNRIRIITPAGVVSTLAGSSLGFSNGVGDAARFSSPTGVAVDASGNIYVADQQNHSIRKIVVE